jgi:hypothetical protein
MTNEQYLMVKDKFPNGPKTKREQAELHNMIYEFNNSVLHLSGGGYVSIRYPSGEIYVFNTFPASGEKFVFGGVQSD